MREVAVAVRERPILFQDAMVRALLAGTKTQTRRAMSRQKQHDFTDYTLFGQQGHSDDDWVAIEHAPDWPDGKDDQCHCPYGRRRSERLWVREAWAPEQYDANATSVAEVEASIRTPAYRADFSGQPAYKWRPSIHMPRKLSRILLEVSDLRVQRLQEISREDALAEGIVQLADGGFGLPGGEFYHAADARRSYFALWERINGAGSVDANPWVWAVSFRRVVP